MASLASINIRFSADLKQFSSQMQNVSRDMKQAGERMRKIGATMSVAVTAPFAALSALSVVKFDQQANAIAQVEAGLRSTGETVGFTSEQLQKMASELQEGSLFGDEVILKDATAQLLTFTNIAGEQFARTQKAALDLSTRLDGDLKSASIQLGKALNDPVANLSALSRSGIQFSESQKETINQMVKMNRLADAQTLILDELEKQYGGSAAAAAKAGSGPLKQLANSWGDLQEQFGQIISEAINPIALKLKALVGVLQNLSPEVKKTILIVGGLVAAVGPLLAIFGTILTLVPSMVAGFAAVKAAFISFTATIAANPFGAIALAIGLVVGGLYAYSQANKEVTRTKSTLDKINERAADNLAKERVELERLVSVAKDESKSKVEREKAIKALNKLSPEYLGNLSLETINTDKAKTAIEGYTQALLQKFRVEAAEAELKELANKRFALELGQLKTKEALLVAEQKLRSNSTTLEREAFEKLKASLQNGNQLISNFYDAEQRLLEGIINGTDLATEANKSLNTELGKRPKLEPIQLPTIQTSSSGTVAALEAEITKLKQLRDQAATSTEQIKLIDAAIKSIEGQIQILVDPTSLIQAEVLTTKLATTVSSLSVVMQEVGSAVGDAFTSIGERFIASLGLAENGLEGFAKVMLQTISKLLSMAIANAIVNATQSASATGPAAAFSQPAFIATAVAGVISAFAAIPKFADGGIVGGSSYYGDKILAAVNSGELILNGKQQRNLMGMMAGAVPQNVNIGVQDIVLEGSKIRIILDRTDELNNRKK